MGQPNKTPGGGASAANGIRIIGATLVAGAIGLWAWQSYGTSGETESNGVSVAPIEPPALTTEGVDPAVVEAVNRATEEVRAQPDSDICWGQLGMVFAAHEFMQQAGICYGQASALNPRDAKWPYLHARTLLLTAPEESIPLLLKSVDVCGNTPTSPRLTLVETLLELYRLDEADEHLLAFEADFVRILAHDSREHVSHFFATIQKAAWNSWER